MSTANRSRIQIAILTLTVLAVAGCGKVPQQAIDGASASLSQAEAAGAGTYAAEQLAAARLAMEAVQAEVAAQGEKFTMFRSYSRTSELVTAAEQAAAEARDAAELGRQQAMTAAQTALEALRGSLQSATELHGQLGQCRRQPKGFATDLATLGGTLAGLTDMVSQVETAIGSGDYLGASETAASVQSQVDGLAADMNAAKTKIGC